MAISWRRTPGGFNGRGEAGISWMGGWLGLTKELIIGARYLICDGYGIRLGVMDGWMGGWVDGRGITRIIGFDFSVFLWGFFFEGILEQANGMGGDSMYCCISSIIESCLYNFVRING